MGGRSNAASLGVIAATIVLSIVACVLLTSTTKLTQLAGAGLLVVIVGVAGVLLHPRIVYGATAAALGAVPLGIVPGVGLPIVLVLAVAFWAAVLSHPITETRTSIIELAVGVLILASLASVIVTEAGTVHWVEFAKWLVATSMVFALLRLDRRDLRRFGLVFAYATGVAAAFALAVFFFDKAGTSLNYLSVIGYGQTGVIGTHLRFYVMENSTVVRLTGTYVDPNAAGIFLLIGLGLAVALLRGWSRLIIGTLIVAALIITLSRAAIFSVAVALALFLIFQKISTGQRLAVTAMAIVGAAGAMTVPAIYSRIVNSFSSSDTGSADRADALSSYLESMSGHWWFGRGWGVPEFTDEVIGYKTNYVANSPLLTIYRGGVFTGIAFLLVLIAGAVLAYRNSRQEPWESGVIGAIFVGFSLVGLQLDFPVVTNASMAMAFSVLIAFLSANPILPEVGEAGGPAPGHSRAPSGVGRPDRNRQATVRG